MNSSQIIFAPWLGWPVLGVLGALCAIALAASIVTQARGAVLRALGLLWLFAILSGPQWVAQTRRPLPDIALIAVDQSPSMTIANRAASAATALQKLLADARKIQNLHVHVIDIPAAGGGGTALFGAIGQALQEIPPAQLAGVIAITDGQAADAPAHLGFTAPFTALLTAKSAETDRELRLLNAPAYGLAGKTVSVTFEVFDHGAADDGQPAAVTITADGAVIWSNNVTIGQAQTVEVPVRHAGPAVIEASVNPLPGEISGINNQAAFTLNGIAKKLQVLLISGNPNQSERSWRLLLKSDPAVELVHFTILRSPGETLDAPPEAVALVPFPVQQLFETDIGKFDLIILDQFNTAGLLPQQYLGNIAHYVQSGGALLVQAGPEFATLDSLALTPLSSVLPAAPAAPGTIEQPFAPSVTPLGSRNPVTAPFSTLRLAPWYRVETVAKTNGDVLMTGGDNAWPLLILAAAGKGRVGMLLSDQFWLWTRGAPHDGPALPLLRRVVHWLLREPALEAEALNARVENGFLIVRRQTLSPAYPGDAAVQRPDGEMIHLVLPPLSPGLYGGALPAALPGVWKISEGGMVTYAASNAANAMEYQNLAATGAILRPLGNTVWLGQNPAPDLASLLLRRHASAVTGARDVPLLPAFPAMVVALSLLGAAWWRERG